MAQRFQVVLTALLVGSSSAWPAQESKSVDPRGDLALPNLRGSGPSIAGADLTESFTMRLTTIWDLCLELPEGPADGRLRLLECTGKPEQQWVYDPVLQSIQTLTDTRRCIDAGNGEDGAMVKISQCSRSGHQRWTFDMADYGLVEAFSQDAGATQRIVFDASETGGGTAVVLASGMECWTQSIRVVSGTANAPFCRQRGRQSMSCLIGSAS